MGREIHYTIHSKRAYTAAELSAANDVIVAFNDLFKDGSRWANDLFNFYRLVGVDGGARFFFLGDHDDASGSTKPFGEAPALFLLAGLTVLSKVLPSAEIEVRDEGVDGTYFAVKGGMTVLRNGKRLDVGHGEVTRERPAHTAAEAGQWVSQLNAFKAKGMNTIRQKSKRGGLVASQLSALFADVERVVFARIAAGNLPDHRPALV